MVKLMTTLCVLCLSVNHEKIGEVDLYSILKCQDCDLRFLDPMPSEKVLTKFYAGESNYSYYADVVERKLKSGKRKIQRLLKYCSGKNFLDIGCSTGANVEAARRLGFTAMGVDLSAGAIKFAKENFPENEFIVADIAQIQREAKRYDLIFCTEIIEHITKPHDFVESLKNIMNTGGILYMTTPDAGHFRVPKKFSSWKHVHAPDHLCYFKRESLKRLLGEHGIQVLKFDFTTQTTIKLIAKKLDSSSLLK